MWPCWLKSCLKKLEFKVKTVHCQVVLQLTLKQFYQISTPLLKPSFDTLEIVSYCRLRIQVDFWEVETGINRIWNRFVTGNDGRRWRKQSFRTQSWIFQDCFPNLLLFPSVLVIVFDHHLPVTLPFPGFDAGKFYSDVVVVLVWRLVVGRIVCGAFFVDRDVAGWWGDDTPVSYCLTLLAGGVNGCRVWNESAWEEEQYFLI